MFTCVQSQPALSFTATGRMVPARGIAVALALAIVSIAGQSHAHEGTGSPLPCPAPTQLVEASPPPRPACDNDALLAYDGLLVLAPHPDDETIAFAGLVSAYAALGKPVEVVVVTDGDAYCGACRFWKSATVHGPTCGAEDLSNFATAEVDSFAEVRRCETAAAAAAIGREAPAFLGYPDTGLAAAWGSSRVGKLEERLRRSDFSHCSDCETCVGGYGQGPETDLTAATLIETLTRLIATTSERTLVATSHWLDGHADHAALGNFVKTINDGLHAPRPTAYAVIHAFSPKETSHSDCWYPAPPALVCPCADEERARREPDWLATLRSYRFRPEWPAALPDDAPYGEETQLCLPDELYRGEAAKKVAAVQAFRSQMGSSTRSGSLPRELEALIDCNGYLISFVRSTEVFVLSEAAACDPTGVWKGRGRSTGGDEPFSGSVSLALVKTGAGELVGSLSRGEGQEILLGEVSGRCSITLRSRQRQGSVLRGSVSRDGKSLYASWDGESPGFVVVHR